jgi:ankyrin repeat protein
MRIEDLINSLNNKRHADFLIDLDRYLKQPGTTIDDADLNLKKTLLISAAEMGRVEVVSMLLQRRAKLDSICWCKRTALMYAARDWFAATGNDARIMSLLIRAGAQIDAIDGVGFTALMFAVHTKQLVGVKFLVENGANIKIRSTIGRTALMWAALENCPDIVEYLLDQDADIEERDNAGMSALDIAIKQHASCATEVLLWRGANLRKDSVINPEFQIKFFNLLKNTGRIIPKGVSSKYENLQKIKAYNAKVAKRAKASGAEIAKNLRLEANCCNIVIDYLYLDPVCRGIFYQAFSQKRALRAPIDIEENEVIGPEDEADASIESDDEAVGLHTSLKTKNLIKTNLAHQLKVIKNHAH